MKDLFQNFPLVFENRVSVVVVLEIYVNIFDKSIDLCKTTNKKDLIKVSIVRITIDFFTVVDITKDFLNFIGFLIV